MSITKEKLSALYLSGKSMAEIATILNCSIHKVVYWMDKYEIEKRTRSDAAYIKLNPNGDPFKIKRNLSSKELILFGLGLGIYMGEGDKVSPRLIRVANTNPVIIRLFIQFLLNICRLEKRKLCYGIVCFNDSNPETARGHWSRELNTPPVKFGKIVQIPTQGKGTYKKKSQFGVCTVIVSNPKLKTWITKEIEKTAFFAGVAQR